MLRNILIQQLDEVLAHLVSPDPDIMALFERLHGGLAEALRELGWAPGDLATTSASVV